MTSPRTRPTPKAAPAAGFAVALVGIDGSGKTTAARALAGARYARFRAPDLTVFLDMDPREAQRRLELRGRDHEELLSLGGRDRPSSG